MIPGTISFISVLLFWILPTLVFYSIYRSWSRPQPSYFFIFVQVWGLVLAYKWFILAAIRVMPEPLNSLALMFSVIPLAPEAVFVSKIIRLQSASIDDWLNTCGMLSFISSFLAGLTAVSARYWVFRKQRAGTWA